MRRILLVVAVVLALAAPAAARASSGPTIVYSDLYLKLIAAYPSGMVPDDCDAVLFVTGRSGICDHRLDPAYFYPDGTFGATPWYADASSPTGWSIMPDPCAALTDADRSAWDAWLYDGSPALTDAHIELYSVCYFEGF